MAYRTGIAAANNANNIKSKNMKLVRADLSNPFLSGSKLKIRLYFLA